MPRVVPLHWHANVRTETGVVNEIIHRRDAENAESTCVFRLITIQICF
jgi:hypothetical protein